MKRAQTKGVVEIVVRDLRDWSTDAYKSVDDRPYGGGAGMVLRVDIIDKALKEVASGGHVILTEAGAPQFTQQDAQRLAGEKELVFICGHYEGVDERVKEHLTDESFSVGPYVLSGGELPAMTMIDAVVRLLPGVLGNPESLSEESYDHNDAEYPHYTRPETYNGWQVPEVLLSGNHKDIQAWRSAHTVSIPE